MSERKWTPKPWKVWGGGGLFVTSDYGEICQIEGGGTIEGDDEANAHLIASAPELYEALEELYFVVLYEDEHNGISQDVSVDLDRALTALNKARGKA